MAETNEEKQGKASQSMEDKLRDFKARQAAEREAALAPARKAAEAASPKFIAEHTLASMRL
jgi:hypothetical protein